LSSISSKQADSDVHPWVQQQEQASRQTSPEEERPTVEGVWSVPAASLRKEAEEPSTLNGDAGNADAGETDSTRSSETQPQQGHRVGLTPAMGETIAYNNRGEPVISRTIASDTGVGVTVVQNDDGTQSTFGKNTLCSLMSSDETDAQTWINNLSTLEVRGLVHEIGQVLLSTSAVYQFHLNRLKDLSETKNYAYFGLSEDATDKEIDMAYRKLAKQMHPDKNGGTPEAKERFQQMKERYEALKEHRANNGPPKPKEEKEERREEKEESGSEKGEAEKEGEDGEEAKEEKEEKRKEAYDEDDEDKSPKTEKQRTSISYDPTDQESLATTAVEMLQRLKAIEGSMTTLRHKLAQHGEVVCM
jgi:molecular chaperone DnaJ